MRSVGQFDVETAVTPVGDGAWTTELSTGWNIGDSANGGYALTPVLRAARDLGGHPDPISVTTHFLRPVQGGGPGRVTARLVRTGRSVSVAAGTLHQADADRLVVNAVFGEVGTVDAEAPTFQPEPPSIPPPDRCIDRTELLQGVELPIASRVDVRIAPERAVAGASPDAVMEGWIRLADDTPPSTMTLPLFADDRADRARATSAVRRMVSGPVRVRRPGRRADDRDRHALGLDRTCGRPLPTARPPPRTLICVTDLVVDDQIGDTERGQSFIWVLSRSTDSMNSSIIS